MFLDNLISPSWAALADPRNFLRRLRFPEFVSFGLLANLNALGKSGIFDGIDGIFDVGANRGQFAYMISRVCPEVPIISIEPDADSFDKLQIAFQRFGIKGRCIRAGLADFEGTAELRRYPNDACNSFLSPAGDGLTVTGSATVPITTLDKLAESVAPIGDRMLLKIDVQGLEMAVLRGARQTLPRCGLVLLEVSFRQSYEGGAKAHEVIGWLESAGFRVYDIVDTLRDRSGRHSGLREADLLFVNDAQARRLP